jgi:hypothetical protein
MAAAAVPFVPMIIGAGAGAMIDRKNPLRGAMLGAVGGSVAAPAIGAMTGIAAPAAAGTQGLAGLGGLGGAEAAAVSAMPGASSLPQMMAGGAGFQGGASAMAGAYNAMPMASRLGALANMGPQGLFNLPGPDKALRMGANMMGQPGGQSQEQAPPPMPVPPQRPPSLPPMPIVQYRSSMRRPPNVR